MLRRTSTVGIATAAVLISAGCLNAGNTDDDDGGSEAASEVDRDVPPATTLPTPFCAGIIELETRLAETDDVDAGALIISTYVRLLPVAPPEIAEDLAAIIAGEGGQDEVVPTRPPPEDPDPNAPPATDIDDPNEGFEPLATPAGRVATYITTNCDDVSSNPGPPPTVPFADTTTTEG